jgi:hypothetical protein
VARLGENIPGVPRNGEEEEREGAVLMAGGIVFLQRKWGAFEVVDEIASLSATAIWSDSQRRGSTHRPVRARMGIRWPSYR